MDLIGGDTCQGPLSITIVAYGLVTSPHYLSRSGAQAGDKVYVSGTLGKAAMALAQIQAGTQLTAALKKAFDYPTPRVELGRALIGKASSCIDISDGLCADLSHILNASHTGAELYLDKIPLTPELQDCSLEQKISWGLAGGDDYELCFTSSLSDTLLQAIAQEHHLSLTCIGEITSKPGLRIYDTAGQMITLPKTGYQHFAEKY
jgi:thiamine-monophosphate kinase